MSLELEIDHIGYAVKDFSVSFPVFEKMGYRICDRGIDKARNVRVAIASIGGVFVELLSPIDNQKSPIDGYLNKMGETPYHICYRSKHIEDDIRKMEEEGFTVLSRLEKSEPLGGNVCFLYGEGIGFVELIDKKESYAQEVSK